MKIANNSLPTDPTTGPSGATSSSELRKASAGDPSSVEDSVEMSDIGRLAAQLENQNAERIEELRRNVQSGNYTVDAGKLSGKLVDSMLSE
ncbi:MAG: flagellar biosynthesis anti-sigma factor FlgM [Bryobacteraceae bacterium]